MAASYRTALRPLTLTGIIFFTVSGGPYGLEPLLHEVGAPLALVLLVGMPFLWCLPAILMVLELNALMPREGGYYWWVREALGLRWGFFEGWWSWLYAMVDLGIYPVLFVEYLSFFFPSAGPWQIPLCLAIIWTCTILNLLGVLTVGRSSVILGAAVMIPFGVLFLWLFSQHAPVVSAGAAPPVTGLSGAAMGMYTVMWNYLGWDNASTIAGEVQRPVRAYGIAMTAAFVLIVGGYVLAILAGATAGIDPATLEEEGFPVLGLQVGGPWLGGLLAAGGMASALGLFLSGLCAVSRLPKAMADDRLLSPFFRRMTPRSAVPYVSILTCAAVISGMMLWGFAELLIIDVTLYGAALMLEFISLVMLRIRLPGAARPFRIPLNTSGIVGLVTLPALCILAALMAILSNPGSHTAAALFALAAVGSGPLAWLVTGRRAKTGA